MRPKEHCFKRLIDKWKLSPLSNKYLYEINLYPNKYEFYLHIYTSELNEELIEFFTLVNNIIRHHYFYCALSLCNNNNDLQITIRRFSLYKTNTPDILYHSTTIQNASKILKTGLIPQNNFDYLKGHYALTFCSNNMHEWIPNGVILKIKAKNYNWYKDSNLFRCNWSFCTDQFINKDDISIYYI